MHLSIDFIIDIAHACIKFSNVLTNNNQKISYAYKYNSTSHNILEFIGV